jgi:hypothetical protein
MKKLLLSQLNESIVKGGWHGPSVLDAVKVIDASSALSKPLKDRHSIGEIVQHIVYWIDRVNGVLNGEKHPKMGDPDDWKPIEETVSEWNLIEGKIVGSYERLRESLNSVDWDMMNETVQGTSFTYSWMLFGLVHHCLYHAGQISILKESP